MTVKPISVRRRLADLGRALAGAAAGAVGDGHEIRGDALERGGGLAQGLDPGLILGREKLQRAQRAVLGEEFGDRPVGGHLVINASEFDDACKAPIASYFVGTAGTVASRMTWVSVSDTGLSVKYGARHRA
jgi:hypothetical protein